MKISLSTSTALSAAALAGIACLGMAQPAKAQLVTPFPPVGWPVATALQGKQVNISTKYGAGPAPGYGSIWAVMSGTKVSDGTTTSAQATLISQYSPQTCMSVFNTMGSYENQAVETLISQGIAYNAGVTNWPDYSMCSYGSGSGGTGGTGGGSGTGGCQCESLGQPAVAPPLPAGYCAYKFVSPPGGTGPDWIVLGKEQWVGSGSGNCTD